MKKTIIFLFILLVSTGICSATDFSIRILSNVNDKDYTAVKAGIVCFLERYKYNIVEKDEKYLITIKNYLKNSKFVMINMEIENKETKKTVRKTASYVFGKDKITEKDKEFLKNFPSEYNIEEVLCGRNIAKKIIESIWQTF